MKFIKAKPISYDSTRKRNRKSIDYIVFHFTGNTGDTAENNANYFAHGNNRQAGAHFFADQKGGYCKSIPLNRTAWSVGGFFKATNGAARFYGKCTNYNSVSIELCDCAKKDPSPAMIKAVKKIMAYIRKYCPNAKMVIRHWDVNGKDCPARMVGLRNKRWNTFLVNIGVREAPKKSTKKKTTKKSNTQIAKEVLAGKWGNGETRKKKLKTAGYDYKVIQKLVNKLVK